MPMSLSSKWRKVKRAAELICQRKTELYLDMAGSAFVSLDEKVMSL
jgi:hypothetical protein